MLSLLLIQSSIATPTFANNNNVLSKLSTPVIQQSNHTDPIVSTSADTNMEKPENMSSNLRTVDLDGEKFTYDQTKLPPPPGIHFSDDISGLFKHWNDSELLVIEGCSIAIKYWRIIYNERESSSAGTWSSGVRNEWGKWRVRSSILLCVMARSVSG